jgi:hypothetical protein
MAAGPALIKFDAQRIKFAVNDRERFDLSPEKSKSLVVNAQR